MMGGTSDVPAVTFITELDNHLHDEFAPSHYTDCFGLRRHYPGKSSRAVAFHVPLLLEDSLTEVKWLGRAGRASFRFHDHLKQCIDVVIIGVHGLHGTADAADLLLAKIAQLLTGVRSGTKVFVMGDFNINALPALPG